MTGSADKIVVVQPLPLVPAGAVQVADGVSFLEDEAGDGCIFVWGMAAWSWGGEDPAARRLAAVQVVNSKAARQRDVAATFGVDESTLVRWRQAYAAQGVAGLVVGRPGPKGPSKLTEDVADQIRAARSEGLSYRAVAERVGVSTFTVRRALCSDAAPATGPQATRPASCAAPGGDLVPLAQPTERSVERAAARFGLIDDAPPVITEGSSLPKAGSLVILPVLSATGLLEVAAKVYGARRGAFYSLRTLVLSIVFCCLLGEPRAEGLTRLDPADMGRLLALDRAPEVKTLRRRTQELAQMGRADHLIMELAQRHVDAHPEATGVFYLLTELKRKEFLVTG